MKNKKIIGNEKFNKYLKILIDTFPTLKDSDLLRIVQKHQTWYGNAYCIDTMYNFSFWCRELRFNHYFVLKNCQENNFNCEHYFFKITKDDNFISSNTLIDLFDKNDINDLCVFILTHRENCDSDIIEKILKSYIQDEN